MHLEPALSLVESSRVFWRVQIVAWSLCGVVYYLAVVPLSGMPPLLLFGGKMIWATGGLAVSSALGWIYQKLSIDRRPLHEVVFIAVGASVLLAPAWLLGLGAFLLATVGSTRILFDGSSFPFQAVNHVFILLAWSGGYVSLLLWDRSRRQERALIEASRLAHQAQLEMLRYQLNPHFLFNTLTSVRALVDAEPTLAKQMITQLSEFMRYTLDRPRSSITTLDQELDAIERYLTIEKVRFGDRLSIDIRVDPAVKQFRVPCFILHPLVENAVKHGEPGANDALAIVIDAEHMNGKCRLTVSNTGTLESSYENRGIVGDRATRQTIGLRNLRERLDACFPGDYQFDVRGLNGWVHATITMTRSLSIEDGVETQLDAQGALP